MREALTEQATNERVEDLTSHVAELQTALDVLQERAAVHDDRSEAFSVRMDAVEDRVDIDQAIISELKAGSLVSTERAAHLEEALRSSRLIGAAIGITMARCQVDEAGAFVLLSKASQNTNCKLRDIAEDLVRSGDVTPLQLA